LCSVFVTRFAFSKKAEAECNTNVEDGTISLVCHQASVSSDKNTALPHDEDGDMIPKRRRIDEDVIHIGG
jgi:hypothetical protein